MNKFFILFLTFLTLNICLANGLVFNNITITATESNTTVEINVPAEADQLIYNNNSINFTNLYQNFDILRNAETYIVETNLYHNYSFSDGAYYIFQESEEITTCEEKINIIIEQYSTFAELLGLIVLIVVGIFFLRSFENENNNYLVKNITEIAKVLIIISIMIIISIIIMIKFGGIC